VTFVAPTYFISKTERVYLVLFGGAISLVNATNLLIVWLEKIYNPPPFGIYEISRASQYPTGRLLSMFIVVILVFAKRYFVSLGWTTLCLIPFLYQFVTAYRVIYHEGDFLYRTPGLQVLSMIANPLDYLAFFMLVMLFVWLVSVVVRSYTMRKSNGE
jgi:hypothetical protein